MGVVVEYVCNYTSVITGVTSLVRMKPNETADVSLEKVGGYVVQVRPQAMLIMSTKVHVAKSQHNQIILYLRTLT